MKIKHTLCSLLLLSITSVPMFAQQTAKAQEQSKEPTAEEKAWMAYSTPGQAHQMMAKSNGMWSEEITMWMAPGAPPMKSTATCNNRMIMGGRYLEGRTRGTFNGMPFEGISTTAYDNAKKVYKATWIDNMGTGIMSTEGAYNQETNTLEMKGTTVDPMTGKEMDVRETIKFIDDNNQQLEMFMMADGKEFKSMEIKMSRKAGMEVAPQQVKPTQPVQQTK